jgi:mannose-6-phosphate isomerase-like protein (cupin superfamily)
MIKGVPPVRRIVVGDVEAGKPEVFNDGPSPDVRGDPGRPGFGMTRIWVTEDTPAPVKGVRETLHLPHTLEPPTDGSVCRYVTIPPDASWLDTVNEDKVRSFFAAMGSPAACQYAIGVPHPYMQRTETLDYVYVLEGSVTLVLDVEEVELHEGDSVVQRGARHAWRNRTSKSCTLVISSHDANYKKSI